MRSTACRSWRGLAQECRNTIASERDAVGLQPCHALEQRSLVEGRVHLPSMVMRSGTSSRQRRGTNGAGFKILMS